MSETGNGAAYRAAIQRFNDGDLDGYLDLYSDDVTFGGVSPEPMDKAGTRAFHEAFLAAFPDARVEIVDLVESGDKLAVRLLFDLVHQGEFMGVPPTGAPAKFAITTVLTMRDGRCVERWSTADMYGLLVQIGGVPAPAG
jgi:predicted ester cyclase